jgi:hypothetical protein
VVNQIVIVPIGGESSKRGAPFVTGVTSGTGLSVVRVVVSSNNLLGKTSDIMSITICFLRRLKIRIKSFFGCFQ